MDALRNGNIFKLPLGIPKVQPKSTKQHDTFLTGNNVTNATQMYNSSIRENFAGLYRSTPAPIFMQNSPQNPVTMNRHLPSIEHLIDARLSEPITPSLSYANGQGFNHSKVFDNHSSVHGSLNGHTSIVGLLASPQHADSFDTRSHRDDFGTTHVSHTSPVVGYHYSNSLRGMDPRDWREFAEQPHHQRSSHDSPVHRPEYSLFPEPQSSLPRYNQQHFQHTNQQIGQTSPSHQSFAFNCPPHMSPSNQSTVPPYSLRSGSFNTHPVATLVPPATIPVRDFWHDQRPRPLEQKQHSQEEPETSQRRPNNSFMEHVSNVHSVSTAISCDVAGDNNSQTPPPTADTLQLAFIGTDSATPTTAVDQNTSSYSHVSSEVSTVRSPVSSPARTVILSPVKPVSPAPVTIEAKEEMRISTKPPAASSPVIIKVQPVSARLVSRVGGRTSGACDSLSMLHSRPVVGNAGPVWPASSSSMASKAVVPETIGGSVNSPLPSGKSEKSSSNSVLKAVPATLSPKRPQSTISSISPVSNTMSSSSSSSSSVVHSPGVRKKHSTSSSSPVPSIDMTSATPVAPAPPSPKKSTDKKAEVLTRSGRASVKPDRTTYEHGPTSSKGDILKQAQALEVEKDRTNADRFKFGWHLNEHRNFYALKASMRFAEVHVGNAKDPRWFEFVDAFNQGGEKGGYPHRSSKDCVEFFERNLAETIARRKAGISSPSATSTQPLNTGGDANKRRTHSTADHSLLKLATVSTSVPTNKSLTSTQQTTAAQSATNMESSGPKKKMGTKEMKQMAVNAVHDPVGDDLFSTLNHHGPNTPQVKALLKRQLGKDADVKTPADSITKRPRHKHSNSDSSDSDNSSSTSDSEMDEEGVTVEFKNKRVAQKLNLPHKSKSQSTHRIVRPEDDVEDDRRKVSKLSQLRTKAENEAFRSGIDPKTKRVEVARRPPKGAYYSSMGGSHKMEDEEESDDDRGDDSETFSDEEGDW